MKIQNFTPFSFQKKLVANCTVIENSEKKPCNIYKLEPSKDRDYFVNLTDDVNWCGQYFLEDMIETTNDWNPKRDVFYAMEDSDSRCLGYCKVSKKDKDTNSLDYLETAPMLSFENEERTTKYVGETLITFLMKMLKREHKTKLYVPCVSVGALDFYYKCNFSSFDNRRYSAITNIGKLKYLEKKNTEHTGEKINLIK